MMKRIFGILSLVGISLVLTGCNAVQGYSVRSYQGPLPMNDYQFLNEDSMGSTVATR